MTETLRGRLWAVAVCCTTLFAGCATKPTTSPGFERANRVCTSQGLIAAPTTRFDGAATYSCVPPNPKAQGTPRAK
jgi:hypothetical protein